MYMYMVLFQIILNIIDNGMLFKAVAGSNLLQLVASLLLFHNQPPLVDEMVNGIFNHSECVKEVLGFSLDLFDQKYPRFVQVQYVNVYNILYYTLLYISLIYATLRILKHFPILDIVLMSGELKRLAKRHGETSPIPPTIGFCTIIATAAILKALSPPFGKLVAEEVRRNGYLRYLHSRIITNAE